MLGWDESHIWGQEKRCAWGQDNRHTWGWNESHALGQIVWTPLNHSNIDQYSSLEWESVAHLDRWSCRRRIFPISPKTSHSGKRRCLLTQDRCSVVKFQARQRRRMQLMHPRSSWGSSLSLPSLENSVCPVECVRSVAESTMKLQRTYTTWNTVWWRDRKIGRRAFRCNKKNWRLSMLLCCRHWKQQGQTFPYERVWLCRRIAFRTFSYR